MINNTLLLVQFVLFTFLLFINDMHVTILNIEYVLCFDVLNMFQSIRTNSDSLLYIEVLADQQSRFALIMIR